MLLEWIQHLRVFVVTCPTCQYDEAFTYGYEPGREALMHDRGNRGTAMTKAMSAFRAHFKEHIRPGEAEAKQAMARQYGKGIPTSIKRWS